MNKLAKEIERFLDKNLSEPHWNFIYSLTFITQFLVKVARSASNITAEADQINSQTVYDRLKCFVDGIADSFLEYSLKLLELNKQHFSREYSFIAVDETYEPYFGNETSFWIHGYKPEKGCTGSYKFLVISIVHGPRRFVLAAVPVYKGMNRTKVIIKILRRIRMVVKIRAVLFDRGFYWAHLIEQMQRYGFRYLILVPKNRKTKKFLESKYDIHYTEMPYSENKTKYYVKAKIHIGRGIYDYDWIFVTNLKIKRALTLVGHYKKRWDIENIFKVTDNIRIRTNSTDIHTKTLLFTISLLIYNLWIWLKEACPMTLKRFARVIVELFDKEIKNKPPPRRLIKDLALVEKAVKCKTIFP